MIIRLQRAADLIASVMTELDVSAEECDECGHVRYSNWDHKGYHDALTGAINRVTKTLGHMQRKEQDNGS